jgi:hypothetical protein
MIQQKAQTITVTTAGTPVPAYTTPTYCCAIFVQAYPGNTSSVLVKNLQGQIIAWLAPGGGNDAASNPLPGGQYSFPPFAGSSLGNPIDAAQYEFDVEVSGEKCQVTIAVAI